MFTRRTPELAPQPPRGLLAGKSIDNPSTNVSPLLSSPLVSEGLRSPRLCHPPGSRRHPVSPPNQLTVRAPDAQCRTGSQKTGWPRKAMGSATAGAERNERRRDQVPTPVQPTRRRPPPMGKGEKDGRVFSPSPGSTVAPTGILYQASLSHLKEKDNDDEGS